jgi:hypothetical protein
MLRWHVSKRVMLMAWIFLWPFHYRPSLLHTHPIPTICYLFEHTGSKLNANYCSTGEGIAKADHSTKGIPYI